MKERKQSKARPSVTRSRSKKSLAKPSVETKATTTKRKSTWERPSVALVKKLRADLEGSQAQTKSWEEAARENNSNYLKASDKYRRALGESQVYKGTHRFPNTFVVFQAVVITGLFVVLMVK